MPSTGILDELTSLRDFLVYETMFVDVEMAQEMKAGLADEKLRAFSVGQLEDLRKGLVASKAAVAGGKMRAASRAQIEALRKRLGTPVGTHDPRTAGPVSKRDLSNLKRELSNLRGLRAAVLLWVGQAATVGAEPWQVYANIEAAFSDETFSAMSPKDRGAALEFLVQAIHEYEHRHGSL